MERPNVGYRVATRLFMLAAVTVLMASFSSNLLAQPDPARMKERIQQRVDDTMKQMALTGEKEKSVRSILNAGAEKQIALFSEGAGGREGFAAMQEKRQAIDKDVEDQLGKVLNEEEMTKYRSIVEKQRAQRGARGGRRGGQ
ncbi:MAG: hypothetical protein KDD65_02785 [Bacteroidetes bacterium]|nr:hypothetical protein [Bacteroidota bacterium]